MSGASSSSHVPSKGTVIADKYRLEDVLGSGGAGCVVEAEHLLFKKRVAVKFVLGDTTAAARGRLFREARAAQALASENVVRVFDIGVHDGAPYIVMELLEGTDLAARVHDAGPLAIEEAVDCLLEACVAVAEAHAVGIVHRDIKPGNLFLTRTATQQLVKVLDFGISKVPDAAGDEDCEKTAENVVLGTPFYMSPEQLRNPATIDARTDVWALGVTLFFLLSGEHPFPGETSREVTAAIFTDPPRDLRALRPELPEELCRVVADALAKRADRRTPSVAALAERLLLFASKRGRLAVDRVGAHGAPPPLVTSTRAPRVVPMTTTDAGLASTMPPSSSGSDDRAVDPESARRDRTSETAAPASRRPATRPRAPAIAILVTAALGAAAWIVMSGAPAVVSPEVAGSPSVASTSATADVATPVPAMTVPETATAAGTNALSSARATPPAEPPPPAPLPRSSVPVPRSSASSSASPAVSPSPARDIDGVPILE